MSGRIVPQWTRFRLAGWQRWAGRLAVAAALLLAVRPAAAQDRLLNASFDPTRELYAEIDSAFAQQWQQQTGRSVLIRTLNSGSGAQARAVAGGLAADVVTLALDADVDLLVAHHLVAPGWQARLPDGAVPFTSVAVLMVRRGNPRGVHDWGDLAEPGISVITPDPTTSGQGRWNFLAFLGWARRQPGSTEDQADVLLRRLYANVAVLDTGARSATNSFVQSGIGDVLIASESEARRTLQGFGGGGFQIIYPSVTIREEPPVAVVDRTVDQDGNRKLADAYLRFLWSTAGQQIAARHHFRPQDPAVASFRAAEFPSLASFGIAAFGGWTVAQADNFGPGGRYARVSAGLTTP